MPTLIDIQALQVIATLQRPGKPDLLKRVVALFENDSPQVVNSIVSAVEQGDLDSVRNAAHNLKSSSAYVGAIRLSDRCRDLERAAREGNLPECMALADGLSDEFNGSLAALLIQLDKAA